MPAPGARAVWTVAFRLLVPGVPVPIGTVPGPEEDRAAIVDASDARATGAEGIGGGILRAARLIKRIIVPGT